MFPVQTMAAGETNRAIRWAYAPCLLLFLSACSPEPVDVRSLSGGLEPISEIDGVFLGMSPEQLRRARPNADLVAYSGFHEVIGGDTVIFGFSGMRVSENDSPPKRSRLIAVAVKLASASVDSLAVVAFERAIAEAQASFGRSPVCHRSAGIGPTGFQTVWVLPSGSLTVTLWSPMARAHLQRGDVFRVMAIVARTPTNTGEAVPCSQRAYIPADLRS